MVPRFLALFMGEELFVLGVISMDVLSAVFVLTGSVMVYAVKPVLKLAKQEVSEKKVLVVKAIGLGISLIGFLRIFEVF